MREGEPLPLPGFLRRFFELWKEMCIRDSPCNLPLKENRYQKTSEQAMFFCAVITIAAYWQWLRSRNPD